MNTDTPARTITGWVYDPDLGSIIEITHTDPDGKEYHTYGSYKPKPPTDIFSQPHPHTDRIMLEWLQIKETPTQT